MLRTFFVYGTLMSGCSNHHVIESAVEQIVLAKVQHAELYMYHKSYFPCMVKGQGSVVGELITIKEQHFETILKRMDRLEEFISPNNPKNFYERVIIEAENAAGEMVTAFCYLYNEKQGNLGNKIEDGNFKAYKKTV